MISMTLAEAKAATEASLRAGGQARDQTQVQALAFHGCSTDSRSLAPGNLFVALRGERFDGHDYIQSAEARGARALLIERAVPHERPALVVADSGRAMGRLAQAWRERLGLPVVAVTGSNGKTTVKEMIAGILSGVGSTHATEGNLNNAVGVPLTLFGLDQRHRHAVVEMGASRAGEIAWLSAITRPDVAVITQCAPAHLAGFGSIAGIARAKAEVYAGLRAGGTAVINADDEYADFWRASCRAQPQKTFAIEAGADVRATNLAVSASSPGACFELNAAEGRIGIRLPLAGRHNVMNALAAAACCLSLGVDLAAIRRGLEQARAVGGRLQIKNGRQGLRIIDDSYNANPASLDAALNVLGGYAGRRYLALGDMAELGDAARELHIEAGQKARAAGLDGLFTLGELSAHAARAFGPGARHFAAFDELMRALQPLAAREVTLLVKGSRAMRMERVVRALTEGPA